MFLPTARVDQMIREGACLLNPEPERIGKYYNDVLFYRTSLRNAMTSLRQQRESTVRTVKAIRKNYSL